MPLLGGSTRLNETELSMRFIPVGQTRVPTDFVTITLSAAAAQGVEQISAISSVAATVIKAGTSLRFINTTAVGNIVKHGQVLVTTDVTIGTVATVVQCSPLRFALEATATSTFLPGMLPIYGLQDFSLQTQDTEVDITHTLSGVGTEVDLIRSAKTFNFSLVQVPYDRGMETIAKSVLLDATNYAKEVHLQLSYPDGEMITGAAKLRNLQLPGNQNEVKKISFEGTVMGESFRRLSAYTFS